VHPYLHDSEELAAQAQEQRDELLARGVEEVCAWLPRLDALVVGPGLGRDEAVLWAAERVVRPARCAPRDAPPYASASDAAAQVRAALQRSLPVVLDGDGLFLVQRDPTLLQGADATRVVLTPNVNEFRRLRDVLNIGTPGAPPLDARRIVCVCVLTRSLVASVEDSATTLQHMSQRLGVRSCRRACSRIARG
jgi:ATP-dependent NAD(P)H-hydrate dehydratase